MKKIYAFFLLTALLVSGVSVAQNSITVQGRPHPKAKLQAVPMQRIASETFTIDSITYWVGNGDNRSAFAVQWNVNGEDCALVWGYRWSGSASGEDMVKAVAKDDPRFFWMGQTGTAYGSTIAGFGYDLNNSGNFALRKDSTILYPDSVGFFSASGYSYDGYSAVDTLDYWQSGWYSGYWSYWTKDSSSSSWGYSNVGASGRVLADGSWDGWNFAVGMSPQSWKKLKAAPQTKISTGIESTTQLKTARMVKYVNMQGMESDEPFNGFNIKVTIFTDGTRATEKILR